MCRRGLAETWLIEFQRVVAVGPFSLQLPADQGQRGCDDYAADTSYKRTVLQKNNF